MTRVVHPRAFKERSVEESIASFRESFRRMNIPELNVKVTWDSEAVWARVRMRLLSGASVERYESYDPERHPRRSHRDVLWTLARWVDAGSRRVLHNELPDTVFVEAIVPGAVS